MEQLLTHQKFNNQLIINMINNHHLNLSFEHFLKI